MNIFMVYRVVLAENPPNGGAPKVPISQGQHGKQKKLSGSREQERHRDKVHIDLRPSESAAQ